MFSLRAEDIPRREIFRQPVHRHGASIVSFNSGPVCIRPSYSARWAGSSICQSKEETIDLSVVEEPEGVYAQSARDIQSLFLRIFFNPPLGAVNKAKSPQSHSEQHHASSPPAPVKNSPATNECADSSFWITRSANASPLNLGGEFSRPKTRWTGPDG